jgi:hypothetical protein
MLLLAIFLTISLTSVPDVLCTKKFPTATKPPPPPPAPPLVVFDQPQTGQAEPPPKARFEYFELIAPNQNGQNVNPTLSISNPDFNVVYRPRQPQQPQRPQVSQPQRPQRPQQQFQKPQRPNNPPPLYQFPQQQRPQRPKSQAVSRPFPPKSDPFPVPGHRFGPQAFNKLQQPA